LILEIDEKSGRCLAERRFLNEIAPEIENEYSYERITNLGKKKRRDIKSEIQKEVLNKNQARYHRATRGIVGENPAFPFNMLI
jgi:hypothetical protein